MTLHIAGAGMAGLLTAHLLRRHDPVIHEAQPTLPHNHAALLRFRSDKVAQATNIPFKRVLVHKAVRVDNMIRTDVTLREGNMYSLKVTGEAMSRSILDLSPVERFVAPPDFIAQMSRGLNIIFSDPMIAPDEGEPTEDCISTIPMPALMKIVNWPEVPEFKWRPIWSVTVVLERPLVDLYQTIYYPDDADDYYRASLTGNTLILEYTRDPQDLVRRGDVNRVLWDFGIRSESADYAITIKRQEYGKLVPLPDEVRKTFIIAMTDLHRTYSVGRFATWRQILLDDVVHDVQLVGQMLTQRSAYARRLRSAKKEA